MRDIKFRAWDADRARMTGDWTLASIIDSGPMFADESWPIMQYTGLKDKNGKEIYDGDILKTPLTPVFGSYDLGKPICAEVFWRTGDEALEQDEEEFGFAFRDTQHRERYDNYYGLIDLVRIKGGVEIIGNIHENPELLSSA